MTKIPSPALRELPLLQGEPWTAANASLPCGWGAAGDATEGLFAHGSAFTWFLRSTGVQGKTKNRAVCTALFQPADKPMRESLDTQGESEERGRGAPFLRSIIAKRELFHKVPVLPFKLSTLCRQLETASERKLSFSLAGPWRGGICAGSRGEAFFHISPRPLATMQMKSCTFVTIVVAERLPRSMSLPVTNSSASTQ